MGSLGTTFALFIALAFSSAQVFAAEPTQGSGTSGEPSHEGEEDTSKKDPEKSDDPDEDLTADLDTLIEDSNKNPDDQPTVLLDKKEAIENRIAQLKEALLKEDDPTKKAALEKKLDKLAKAAEKIANVLTARFNANIERLQAAKKPEAPKPAPVASTAPVPAADSTHLKGPQSSSPSPSGSRSVPISNEGSGNRSYAYSDRTNGGAVAPRTPIPSGKSSVPPRIPAAVASNSGSGSNSSAVSTPDAPGVATAPSAPYVASSTNVGSSPIVSAPSRMPASSPVLAAVEMPKLSAPAVMDAPTSGIAPISRRQAEAAGVTVAATPQARLANNLAASVEDSSREFSRGVTRKNEIGSTKNLYPAIASGSSNAEAPKGTTLASMEIYDKSPTYDSKPAANSFYGKTTSARAQGQYIVLGNRGDEGEAPEAPAANVTALVAAEPLPTITQPVTGPAKFARAAFKPVPTYNSPTVKEPIIDKSKASPDALANKKLDFKNFRENPFL